MRVEMVVAGLAIDSSSNTPVVVLRERDSKRVLPIWIGIVEASAIAFELESVKLQRPMTHDLLRTVILELGGTVEKILIASLRETTYFATIVVSHHGKTADFDARPSDAIALALRFGAKILCEEEVLVQAHLAYSQQPDAEGSVQTDRGDNGPRPIVAPTDQPWSELLASLDADAFGKYKM